MIHLRIFALCPLLLFMSCLKPPEIDQDFGPEIAKSEVEKALNSIPTASPYSIETGEFVFVERIQQIESSAAQVIFQRGDTVTSKTEESDHYVLTIVTEIRELVDGAFKPSRKEEQVTLSKPQNVFQLANLFSLEQQPKINRQSHSATSIRSQSLGVKSEAPANRITYHNLSTKDLLFPTPALTKERPNCGGLSVEMCQSGIPATLVTFDVVVWEERGGDKSSYQFILTKHVPFFASQVSSCVSGKLDYMGQRVSIVQCENVRDFTWGTPEENSAPFSLKK